VLQVNRECRYYGVPASDGADAESLAGDMSEDIGGAAGGGTAIGAGFGFAAFFFATFFTTFAGTGLATAFLRAGLAAFFATFFALLTVFTGRDFFFATLLFAPACLVFPTGRFLVLLFFFAMITFLLAV
jgi:hypothetical protein